MHKLFPVPFAALSLLASAALPAGAGGFAVREQSAIGNGMTYAGNAAGSAGLSGLFWNPALVTSKAGTNSEFNLFAILNQSQLDDLTFSSALGAGAAAVLAAQPDPGQIGVNTLLPAGFSNYQVNDRLYFGLGLSTPFGLGTSYNPGSSIAFEAEQSRVGSVNINPVIGYRINDELSIAAGPMLQYLDATLTQTLGPALVPLLAAEHGRAEGNDIGFGFTLGALWQPLPQTSIGVGFRSAVFHKLEGEQSFSSAIGPIPAGSYPITADVVTPEQLTVSLRQEVSKRFAFSGTAEWTNWSRLQDLVLTGSPAGTALPFNYSDGLFFSLGGDYKIDDRWTLRSGVGYELSPSDEATRSVRLPDNDRLWLSLGATYDVSDKVKFSAGYSLVLVQDAFVSGSYDAAPTLAAFTGTAETTLHLVGVSLSYRWN